MQKVKEKAKDMDLGYNFSEQHKKISSANMKDTGYKIDRMVNVEFGSLIKPHTKEM